MEKIMICRSPRKSVSIEVLSDETILVRAPYFLSRTRIENILSKKEKWIQKRILAVRNALAVPCITKAEFDEIRQRTKDLILPRVKFWSEKYGFVYSGVKITSARRRFGSCSGKNSLCFSAYLSLFPLSLVDYVIVHELCHTKHHNHSKDFYRLVESILPDWKVSHEALKGAVIPEICE